jgi:hypothetical protein
MAKSIDNIKQIKARHEKGWLEIEGVVAVGIGTTADGSLGLIVSVKENVDAIRKRLPRSIEGVIIEVQETGEIKAL